MIPLIVLLILALFHGSNSAPGNKEPFVVIVGAGPSGIAAASKLLENNFNFTVLEAEDRFGGRVNSVKFGDAFIDLGAEWCHGEKGNIVYDMVKDLGILKGVDFPDAYYLSNGSKFDENLGQTLGALFKKMYFEENQPEGISLGHYFLETINNEVSKMFGQNSEEYKSAILIIEGVKRVILSSEGAFSWFSPSAKSDFEVAEGNLQLTWNGKGFKTILEILMKQFPKPDPNFNLEEKIQLKKQVKQISLNENDVDITCSDGSKLQADHVIFTPSVGVLKHDHSTLFNPVLDSDKIFAIENLGLDAVMKVMCRFESRWWPEDETGYNFVWSHEDRTLLPILFRKGPLKCDSSWLMNLMGAFRVENNPQVLSVWFTGQFVPEIEKMPDDLLHDGIEFALNRFLGTLYNVTKIVEMKRSSWYTNENFRGTYSFQTISSRQQKNPSSNEILSRPINGTDGTPRILFAGEATNPNHHGTVHGAIETGFREADRLTNLYKK